VATSANPPHCSAASSRVGRTDDHPFFLGSSIGNLDPASRAAMLADLDSAHPGDALFLGADLRKSPEILEAAYDDSLGVTAAST